MASLISEGKSSPCAWVCQLDNRRIFFTNHISIAQDMVAKSPDLRHTMAVDTFPVAQLAANSRAGSALEQLTARLTTGGNGELIREQQDSVLRWRQLDTAMSGFLSNTSKERNPEQEKSTRESLEKTVQRLDLLDSKISIEFPAYAELSNPKPLTVTEVQQLLGGDEALVVYLVTEEASWLWVVRRDDIGFYRLDDGINKPALASEVTSLLSRLDTARNPDLLPYPAIGAYHLYQKLLAPAAAQLSGVHHLLVVADGALESLPFGVLVTKLPERDPISPADHRDVAWLARDFAVTVLPAVSSLRALRQISGNTASAPKLFLGVGDPVLGATTQRGAADLKQANLFRGPIAAADAIRNLPPLPETADELREIAKVLGVSDDHLLLGARANEQLLRQMPLDRYRIIEFATHALVAGDLPGLAEPGLVLTPPDSPTPDDDGLLTASQIATLKLNADWVVLSACNTAAGDGTPDAEGLSGLAKAFFYAGARSLLVSHWAVLSDATVQLTTGAFSELAKDPSIGRAEALRRSMTAMLDPSRPPEFAHPLTWGPFEVIGEGGEGR